MGIMHRDISHRNILLGDIPPKDGIFEFMALLIDFDFAIHFTRNKSAAIAALTVSLTAPAFNQR